MEINRPQLIARAENARTIQVPRFQEPLETSKCSWPKTANCNGPEQSDQNQDDTRGSQHSKPASGRVELLPHKEGYTARDPRNRVARHIRSSSYGGRRCWRSEQPRRKRGKVSRKLRSVLSSLAAIPFSGSTGSSRALAAQLYPYCRLADCELRTICTRPNAALNASIFDSVVIEFERLFRSQSNSKSWDRRARRRPGRFAGVLAQ